METIAECYEDGRFKVPALFYADDGLLLTHTQAGAERILSLVTEVALACGLEINKAKSNILIFNAINPPNEIQEIKVVSSIKYLGVHINNKRNYFRTHKDENLKKAKQLANTIYSVLDRSSDRLLIGKTFWKGLAMPTFLYGSETIVYGEDDLRQLQTIDNQVYRAILRTPKYTANCGMRAEIGASSAKARDIKNKLLFAKHAINENTNDLVKAIF